MMKSLKSRIIHRFGRLYCEEVCRAEYEAQQFLPNERVVEYRFVFHSVLRTSPTTVLDVGTGKSALPHLLATCGYIVTAIDNIYDYWPGGMFNRHFHVINDDITNTKLKRKFDFITCVSTLEHIKEHKTAIQSLFTVLNPGGHLVLTFPYNENMYIENVYKLPGAGFGKHVSYICQVFSRNELDDWLKTNKGIILEQEYWQCYTGNFWTFGEDVYPPRQVDEHEKHHLSCILIQKR